jgi:valyl-tRNA synthetase
MMDKTFEPAAIETRMRALWDEVQAFKAGRPERLGAKPYSIMIPPPNVTGSLHIGHALNNTLQDVLCRFERMRGRDVLWQPGMDHAGIATQMVVERQLQDRQEPDRRTMGREAFVERVWAWKAESGGQILDQLQRLGASCDWSRTRFTMDEGLSEAVLEAFVSLHKAGLIYRDKRLVNWDPGLGTAVSDIEVVSVEMRGSLWHFRYPIEGEPGRFITVATTRPETMLGDTAVAVHPNDERYRDLVGRHALLPLVGRRIPIVADAYSDPDKGSGAVKITPGHDFNDFEVGRRHALAVINIFDAGARLAIDGNTAFLEDAAPEDGVLALHGLDRAEARKRVVALMDERGLLEKTEPHTLMVPHGDRSNAVIEPWLTDQWYVDAAKLAGPALDAVRDGDTSFHPKSWEKTYFDWLENIQPWCVSRQLWWGHRIPAWYGPDGRTFVEKREAEARAAAEAHYGRAVDLRRDEDVLDTWFSSGLWAFSTLGWPHATPELARYYPTSTLVTGFDIIFFWVARMMMLSLFVTGETPFKDVYIHALVRDEKGAKMSKSKGNVVDPLTLIDDHGADALRFTLAAMAAQGRDIKLSVARIEGYKGFATKLWNATRFLRMNQCRRDPTFEPGAACEVLSRWILGESSKAVAEVTGALDAFRFNDAAAAAYRFVWNVFCDWFIELAKPVLQGEASAARTETRAVAAAVLDDILKLLHPFMPFVTEAIWGYGTAGEDGEPARETVLALALWPRPAPPDRAAEAEIGWVIDLVSEVRSFRSEMSIGSQPLALSLVGATPAARARAEAHRPMIESLARLSRFDFVDGAPAAAAQLVVRDTIAAIPLAGLVDATAERARLSKEKGKLDADVAKIETELGNENFLKRAKEEAIEAKRERREDALMRLGAVARALDRLASIE